MIEINVTPADPGGERGGGGGGIVQSPLKNARGSTVNRKQ